MVRREPWSREEVALRFREAGHTLRRLPSGYGPHGYGSGWPDVVQLARDAYGYTEARVRPPAPSPAAIDRMMEVFGWFRHFDGRDAEMRAVWACVACGRSFAASARYLGISRPTIRARVFTGIERVVDALNREASAVAGLSTVKGI